MFKDLLITKFGIENLVYLVLCNIYVFTIRLIYNNNNNNNNNINCPHFKSSTLIREKKYINKREKLKDYFVGPHPINIIHEYLIFLFLFCYETLLYKIMEKLLLLWSKSTGA